MKKTLLTVWGIVFLLLVALISIYFLLRPKPGHDLVENPNGYKSLPQVGTIKSSFFNQPIDEASGIRGVDAYRQNLPVGSYGVIYDAGVIQRYLTNDYPRLKKKMGRDTSGYTWKVGFYWMITRGNDNLNRLSFCVVPTLVSKTDSTKRLDYFNDTLHYNRPNTPPEHPSISSNDGNVYNEGQLWP
ncbi:hypothetical protein FAM09_28870 [Niastella caeni]|uniref:Uncharacterized protein n=1 Tax=Niastella caeni TaxID=2569763 RepID=A0A4S8HAI6_9BACT|nr:hypothetical protein [Niastella caeni]THU31099.1 hypothetical protein FAM09_28870 [Niastella caeni]